MSEAIDFVTFEEFLAGEIDAPARSELVGGRVYAMSGGTERHDLAAQLLYERFVAGARPKGCRTFVGNRLLQVSKGEAYYPDVMVICGPRAHSRHETSPSLIVEVLSPSTERTDRREKATAYLSIPSVETYILVNPVFYRMEQAIRGRDGRWQWRTFEPGGVLYTAFGDVVLEEFYDLEKTPD